MPWKTLRECRKLPLFLALFSLHERQSSHAVHFLWISYFSYVSVLHLYESLGWWRKAEYLKVHFAESWNEQHHLLIMEEMGGSDRWIDRFIAQHVAVFYYWIVVTLYMHNPTMAYNLNQAVEEEAFATYSKFIEENAEYLKSQPAPRAAKKYYAGDDLYLFDAMHFQGNGRRDTRRPKMESLLDAFSAVRDDELEHVKTMAYLQEDACLADDN
jgi:ubiquinol oxidase